ncbi:MAG TPA: DUF1801 domain-containing protein [Verrucomicrobiae bacterium]|nr:DUF1801 domain-containing protein [Verrucomicrobiae bacterium]
MNAKPPITTIDQYIAAAEPSVRPLLQKLRKAIRTTAPAAEEAISYRIPTFKLHGNLVHFAAFKNHIGFYPTSSGIAHFKDQLSAYKHSRGAVQFPLEKPIPYALVRKITKFRVRENQVKAGAKRGKSRS